MKVERLSRFCSPLGQGTIPVGPPGLASSTPAKPGPDGPGYYLTALRALCVANHPVATDSVLLWRTNCDRNGVFLAAHLLGLWCATVRAGQDCRHQRKRSSLVQVSKTTIAVLSKSVETTRRASASFNLLTLRCVDIAIRRSIQFGLTAECERVIQLARQVSGAR